MNKPKVYFAREGFVDMYPEMLPLLEKHYNEIAWNIEKIPLHVDIDKYAQLDGACILFCFSAREAGRLIGYAAFLVHPHPHYMSTVFATNDVIFIEKSHRGRQLGAEFLEFCETELKAFGVQAIAIRIKNCLNWAPLAEACGFEPVESTHLKWVGD